MITNYDSGYCIIRGAVPSDEVLAMSRMLLLEIVNWGLTKEQFAEYHQTKAWFPTLRPHVAHLADYIPSGFKTGEMCEPQILLHFPDEATEYEIHPHLDEEPEWANGRKYRTIAGVALTASDELNGGLVSWGKEDEPVKMSAYDSIVLDPGDVIIFDPKLWHSSCLNRTGEIRMMVYFRWLDSPDAGN
jgi:hypothetical protein